MTALPVSFAFEAAVTADGRPASGVPVLVTLKMARGNDYHVVAGVTDSDGKLEIDRSDLFPEVTASRSLFPADYAPIDGTNAAFTGQVEVHAMSLPEVEAALRAYDLFHTVVPYSSGHRGLLEKGHRALVSLAPRRLDTQIAGFTSGAAGLRFETTSVPYPVLTGVG